MLTLSKAPAVRLYSFTAYDRGAKVRWLLAELGVQFEVRRLDRSKNEQESPEFLRLNPMGRIPVLQVGEITIFESGAICAYLADLHMEQGISPPLTSPDRAKYL